MFMRSYLSYQALRGFRDVFAKKMIDFFSSEKIVASTVTLVEEIVADEMPLQMKWMLLRQLYLGQLLADIEVFDGYQYKTHTGYVRDAFANGVGLQTTDYYLNLEIDKIRAINLSPLAWEE